MNQYEVWFKSAETRTDRPGASYGLDSTIYTAASLSDALRMFYQENSNRIVSVLPAVKQIR